MPARRPRNCWKVAAILGAASLAYAPSISAEDNSVDAAIRGGVTASASDMRRESEAHESIDVGREAPAYTAPGTLARVEHAEGRHVEDTLYGVDEGILGLRIGWHFDTIEAYEASVDKSLPLFLVLHNSLCKWCWEMVDKSLTCPSLNRFAGRAVFAIADTAADAAADSVADSLGITRVPAVTLLASQADGLQELGRFHGFMTGDELVGYLTEIFGWQEFTPEEMTERVKTLIAEQLGIDIETITEESRLIDDLNADELDFVELLITMEEEFGWAVSDADAEGFVTVGDVAEHARLSQIVLGFTEPLAKTPVKSGDCSARAED